MQGMRLSSSKWRLGAFACTVYEMEWCLLQQSACQPFFKAGKMKQTCFLHLLWSNLKMSILCTAASAWLRACPSPVTLNIHLSALFQIKPTILIFITIDVYSLNFLFSLNTKLQSSKRYSSWQVQLPPYTKKFGHHDAVTLPVAC